MSHTTPLDYPYDTFTAASVVRTAEAHVVSATAEVARATDLLRASETRLYAAREALTHAQAQLAAFEAREPACR